MDNIFYRLCIIVYPKILFSGLRKKQMIRKKVKQKSIKKNNNSVALTEAGVVGVGARVRVTAATAGGDGVVSPPVTAPVTSPASSAGAVFAMQVSAQLGCRFALAPVVFACSTRGLALQVGRVPVYQLGQQSVDTGPWMDGVEAVPSF